jgi:energy-coupling factor transport system ATP-binding protein
LPDAHAPENAELTAEDLSFAYLGAPRAALRHVNLAVSPGELVLITGASGCGKSTLALALAGLIPSRVHGELRGRVLFDGKPLSGLAPHEAAQFVGLVFQNPNLQLINMTVQSEVAFGPENLALPQPEIVARVDWALDVTGMDGMRKATVVTLSGGQKQRTAIAATLAMRPRLLVLDEPLSDLDPVGAQEVLGTLRRLAAEGSTGVVVIEHRVDEVVPWADRIVLMDGGKIILDRPPRGVWDDETPWTATGVGIPDVVRLARAIPEAFPGGAPLSVEEAVGALRGGWFEAALASGQADRKARPRAEAGYSAGGSSPGGGPDPAAYDGPSVHNASQPVLSWQDVTVAFGGRKAVDQVSLDVGDDEWVALIGANGSGKSTLIGLSVGLGAPQSGVVAFRGRPVKPGRVYEHAANVALLLQAADEMLFADHVLAELEFGFRFRGRPADPVLDVAGAIEFFGFSGLEDASPWELSQGGRQRLALAALLVGAPGVLVLDEPTTGQDADHLRAFLSLLDRIRERTGLTVVVVTHDMRSVASRAARAVLLGDGRVQLDGPPSQVFARTAELARWGILAPPLARLQSELLGEVDEVFLTVEALAEAVAPYRPAALEAR